MMTRPKLQELTGLNKAKLAFRSCGIQALVAITTVSGFAYSKPSATDKGNLGGSGPVATLHRWFETGKASWYGLKFQGRKTATGEAFNMNELTCAHRSAPLGSWLRVTNLRNHKSVVVRVNDRGPMIDDRIIDLSYAAARVVGLNGVARVRVEVASGPTSTAADFVSMVDHQLGLKSLPVRLA